mmetsp:Transcript_26711/g.35091  ORF Transcript_26711/g.35091 Transcript_26711/m.35091 type:complete len:183 (+) Transcript_26711:2-550(+)
MQDNGETFQEKLNEVLVVMDGSEGKKKLAAKRNVKAMGRFKTLDSHNLPSLHSISELELEEACLKSHSPRGSSPRNMRTRTGSYTSMFSSYTSKGPSPSSVRATRSSTLRRSYSKSSKHASDRDRSFGNLPSPGGMGRRQSPPSSGHSDLSSVTDHSSFLEAKDSVAIRSFTSGVEHGAFDD